MENAKILLVSGLDLVNNADQLSLDLLSEWITGMAGSIDAQEEEAVIARVIIAGKKVEVYFLKSGSLIHVQIIKYLGNTIRGSANIYHHKGYHETKSYDQLKIKEDITAMHKLDAFLSNILHCCCVVLMPGEFDPTCNYSMPQQPFHPCTLQKSAR